MGWEGQREAWRDIEVPKSDEACMAGVRKKKTHRVKEEMGDSWVRGLEGMMGAGAGWGRVIDRR